MSAVENENEFYETKKEWGGIESFLLNVEN